jgi:hypothetical protein
MMPHHVDSLLMAMGCLWRCLMRHDGWPSRSTGSHPEPSAPVLRNAKRKRSTAPQPFTGLTHRPYGAACAHDAIHPQASPPRRPEPIPPTNRRPCTIDTSRHFCPHVGCDSIVSGTILAWKLLTVSGRNFQAF